MPGLDRKAFQARLSGNVARFLARDLMLDGQTDAEAAARFDVRGYEHLRSALAQRRGVIVLGSHFGAHVAAIHWLYREGAPLRLLVQRPRHVSKYSQRHFDRKEGPHPQTDLFLKRNMPASEASARLVSARRALRDGMAVYLSGDIPWPSASARPGRLMGVTRPFLGLWADLAALTRAVVVPVFATHQPGGRFAIRFDPAWTVEPGTEGEAVERYLERLDAVIARRPTEAVAHLTWPCYLEENPPQTPPAAALIPPRARRWKPISERIH